MNVQITWRPLATPFDINDNGKLDPRERRALPDSAFAFPHQRELPLVDQELTREAIAEMAGEAIAELARALGASAEERELAANNIRAAANYYGIEATELAP